MDQSIDLVLPFTLAGKDIPNDVWDRVVELQTPELRPISRCLRAAALVRAGNHRRAVSEIAAIADEPLWQPAQVRDLARIVAAALGKVASDPNESTDERAQLSKDYAERTAALLTRTRPTGDRLERWTYFLTFGVDPEFKPFFHRLEGQAFISQLDLFRYSARQ